MLLLDTNVLSEIMRPRPHPDVAAWMMAQIAEELFTTAITQAEILRGIQSMPVGRRRNELEVLASAFFRENLADRILPFDKTAAPLFAEIFVSRQRMGREAKFADVQIAAIARLHNSTIVTRNIRDFTDCGIRLINPWEL